MAHYDLLVIGSGPAGQKGAIQAAKLNKRVGIIDRSNSLGGMCIQRGAIPSKTLREAVLYYTGFYHRQAYGVPRRRELHMGDLLDRCSHVVDNEVRVVLRQLDRNRVDLLTGEASLVDAHTVRLKETDQTHTADNVLITTGTTPARPSSVPFLDGVVVDSDGLGTFKELPRTLLVVGAGVIGTEYASMLALLDIEVTLIDQGPRLLEFVDTEIAEALAYHMRDIGVILHFGEEVVSIETTSNQHVQTTLRSGKRILTEALLYAVGRNGATRTLKLDAVGIETDARGRLTVNENFQTTVPHIYAAGDVIGFPSLASAAMEQGRVAICHAFGIATQSHRHLLPYGIYSVPEISMVGKNEKQLTQEKIPYEIGVARYREIARGQILGDRVGMLKLLFHPDTRELLGVHVIGQGATELVHIGQMVLTFKGRIDVFIESTFNYPTLAECYRVAALDGYNKVASSAEAMKAVDH
jgi:NAD(P) transhydrogenase